MTTSSTQPIDTRIFREVSLFDSVASKAAKEALNSYCRSYSEKNIQEANQYLALAVFYLIQDVDRLESNRGIIPVRPAFNFNG